MTNKKNVINNNNNKIIENEPENEIREEEMKPRIENRRESRGYVYFVWFFFIFSIYLLDLDFNGRFIYKERKVQLVYPGSHLRDRVHVVSRIWILKTKKNLEHESVHVANVSIRFWVAQSRRDARCFCVFTVLGFWIWADLIALGLSTERT